MVPARERAVAFVVVRLSSSRLPAKQLRKIGQRTILEWIVDNLRLCQELDGIVLATVAEPENEILREVAQRLRLPLFWYEGDVNHVTTRLRLAAEHHQADICLLISADCPLIHAPAIDELIRRMRRSPEADCLTFPPLADGRHCLLDGTQIARLSAWQRADDLSDRPEWKEHQFPVLYRNPHLFRHISVTLDTSIYGPRHRLSVDTWADMEFMNTLHDRLAELGRPFQLPETVRLLEKEPGLRLINSHVHQRELVECLRNVLVIVDAGGDFGYQRFLRARELAGQIVERLSWPVTFLIDSQQAAQMAEECGFKVLWGAMDRGVHTCPTGKQILTPAQAAADIGLVVVDISPKRRLISGWRKRYFPDIPVALMEPLGEYAEEADLVVVPGVAGGHPLAGGNGNVKILQGMEYAVIRREVTHQAYLDRPKDLDLLVDLHRSLKRSAVETVSARLGWKAFFSKSDDPVFPELLSRSRILLSAYGPSFYEALALGTRPVAWPTNPQNQADALAFFAAAGLPAAFVWGMREIEETVGAILDQESPGPDARKDGTYAIVREMASLCPKP